MKLRDIIKLAEIITNEEKTISDGIVKKARNERNVTVSELLKINSFKPITSYVMLNMDEIEFTGYVVSKLEKDALYEPSESLLTAIQMVISKIELGENLYK